MKRDKEQRKRGERGEEREGAERETGDGREM